MEKLSNIIESIVFLSGRAIAIRDISDKLEVTPDEVLKAAGELKEKYSGDCGIHLLIFNKKLQFSSNPDYVEPVEAVLNPIKERELSKAMLEVAAIIAYRQPITRLEIEEVRGGVNSDYSINLLTKQNLIEVVGRKDAIGKPLLFGTTDEFLKRFQLSSLDDLPDYDELLSRIRILHAPANSDLFYKEEYVEPDAEAGQTSAAGENSAPDASEGMGEDGREQTSAAGENSASDASEGTGEAGLEQTSVAGENSASDAPEGTGEAGLDQTSAAGEGPAPDVSDETEPTLADGEHAADPGGRVPPEELPLPDGESLFNETDEGEIQTQDLQKTGEDPDELDLDELPDFLKDEENLQIIE